jgi:hypothetical protein
MVRRGMGEGLASIGLSFRCCGVGDGSVESGGVDVYVTT